MEKYFGIAAVTAFMLAACGEATNGTDGKDGAQGVAGVDGTNGKDGTSCTVVPLANADLGYKILCGGDSVGVLLNGVNGTDGAKGDKGDTGAQGIQGEKGDAGTDGKDGETGKSCTVVPLASDAGYSVYCGDDHIGDLLNGFDGKDGEDGKDGTSCNMVDNGDETVTITCGDKSFTIKTNGSGDVTEEETFEIVNRNVTGVSQKGPFVNGSTVTLYELSKVNMSQTGKSFIGNITTDDGLFKVSNINLTSSYVKVTANGYYRNEVTGGKSTSQITLNALTDLTDRENVNVNLLTHLEFDRANYLLNEDGQRISTAKKNAKNDVFNAFYVTGVSDNTEDLNIFTAGEGNAALLAISIMLQGDLSDADLTARLSAFSTDLEKDGTWDDKATRAKIADWADSVDLGLKGELTLSKIKDNVSSWGLGTVPAFEKYVRNFWYKEFGLGDCDEGNANVVVRDTNSKSAYYSSKFAYAGSTDKKVRFICDEKSKLWRRATDLEKDTFGWGHDFKTGDVRNGQINTNLVYVYEDDKWRHGTVIDSLMNKQKADGGKVCTKGSLNDTSAVKINDLYYVCSVGEQDTSYRWVKAPDIYNDTYEARSECSATGKYGDGTILDGRVNSSNKYVCDVDVIRLANTLEKTLNQGCVSYMYGKNIVNKIHEKSDYECSANGWIVHKESMEYAGQTYKTVRIGKQTWMAENLNYDPGDVSGMGEYAWSGCYDNNLENCKTYGRLYTWEVAMNKAECAYGKTCNPSGVQQGVCPEGWHLPTLAEFDTLLNLTGQKYSWFAKDDVFGFSLLPAGYRNKDSFKEQGSRATLWSSSMNGTLVYNFGATESYAASTNQSTPTYAYSVRCLKD